MDSKIYALKRSALIFSLLLIIASLRFIDFKDARFFGFEINTGAATFIVWFLFVGTLYYTALFLTLAWQNWLERFIPLITQKKDFESTSKELQDKLDRTHNQLETYVDQISKHISRFEREVSNITPELQNIKNSIEKKIPLNTDKLIQELKEASERNEGRTGNDSPLHKAERRIQHGFLDPLSALRDGTDKALRSLLKTPRLLTKQTGELPNLLIKSRENIKALNEDLLKAQKLSANIFSLKKRRFWLDVWPVAVAAITSVLHFIGIFFPICESIFINLPPVDVSN